MERYQGWANYPTWTVNMWLTNDQEMNNAAIYLTETAPDISQLAQELEKVISRRAERHLRVKASFVADLLNWALGQVDWNELAEEFWAELRSAETALSEEV